MSYEPANPGCPLELSLAVARVRDCSSRHSAADHDSDHCQSHRRRNAKEAQTTPTAAAIAVTSVIASAIFLFVSMTESLLRAPDAAQRIPETPSLCAGKTLRSPVRWPRQGQATPPHCPPSLQTPHPAQLPARCLVPRILVCWS